MKKSILEVYGLAVCFATVVCGVIALGIASYSLVQMINPSFTMNSYTYDRYQSNDAFWRYKSLPSYPPKKEEAQRPPEAELTKERLEGYQTAVRAEYRSGAQGFVKSFIVIIIDALFFFFHWRIARRARETSIAA